MAAKRAFYKSENDDTWCLAVDTDTYRAVIVHEPNKASGGKLSQIDITSFLARGKGPEQQALVRLMEEFVSSGSSD